jgi:predicted metal-dependent peptidase
MHYASLEEVELKSWEQMDFYGWGGTSFVPVFDRIDELIEENKKIDCLIYLTDACGAYPKGIPDYPVFFVLPEAYKDEETPDWIQKIVLEEKNG